MVRQSRHIDRRQVQTLRRGLRFAGDLGRAPNLFVTLQFGMTACEPENVSSAFEKLRDHHFTRWLRHLATRPGAPDYGPPIYAWVVEQAANLTHVHWLVYVPPALQAAFRAKLRPWLVKVGGMILDEDAIDVRPADTPSKAGLYLAKGIHPNHAKKHGVRYTSFQGVIHGKRCGVSKSIGPAAIRRHWEARTATSSAVA